MRKVDRANFGFWILDFGFWIIFRFRSLPLAGRTSLKSQIPAPFWMGTIQNRKSKIQNPKSSDRANFGFWILDFGLFFGSGACPLRAEQV
jgi:hypothetical protein